MNLIGVAMGAKSWRVMKIPYTRLEEEETLIGNGTVFFANQLNFLGSNYLGFGTVEIRKFHSASTKNTSLDITFVS